MDEIDANESPLAPQTEGGFSIAFYSVKTETPTQKKIFTYLALNVRDWMLLMLGDSDFEGRTTSL